MVNSPALLLLGSTPALLVYYDTANQWLYAEWQGAYEADTALQSAQLLIECLRAYPCERLLNDTQHVTSGWNGKEQWAGETLFRSLAQVGIRFIACVYSERWPARYSLDITMGYVTKPFIVSFDDLATAYAWLRQTE